MVSGHEFGSCRKSQRNVGLPSSGVVQRQEGLLFYSRFPSAYALGYVILRLRRWGLDNTIWVVFPHGAANKETLRCRLKRRLGNLERNLTLLVFLAPLSPSNKSLSSPLPRLQSIISEESTHASI